MQKHTNIRNFISTMAYNHNLPFSVYKKTVDSIIIAKKTLLLEK